MRPDRLFQFQKWVRCHQRPILSGLIAVAVLSRIALFAGSPTVFGYVYDRYHVGVRVVHHSLSLPRPEDCWVCAHPPLFFIVGAIPYSIGYALGGGRDAVGLRSLSVLSLACVAWVLFSCWRLLRLYRIRGVPLVAAMALAVSLPCLFISTWAPEADILLTAVLAEFIVRLLRVHHAPDEARVTHAIGLGILAGAALLTKYSGVLALLWAGGVFGIWVLRGPRRGRALCLGLIVVACAGGVAGWRYVRSWRDHGTPLVAQGTAAEGFSPGLRRGHWDQYDVTSLHLIEVGRLYGPESSPDHLTRIPLYNSVWTTLHAMAWSDMSLSSEPARHGEQGLYPRKQVTPGLVVGVLFLALLPTALGLLGGGLWGWRGRYWPLLWVGGSTLALYFFWVAAQDAWALKTKYILFLFPPALVFFAKGLQRILTCHGRVVNWATLAGLAALFVATEVFLFQFSLG